MKMIVRQPENVLYNENPLKLQGDAPVLAPAGQAGGTLGPALPGSDAKAPRDWFLLVVWRQRWLIAITTLLACVAAVLYLMHATPMYTGTAKLSVAQLNVNVGPNSASEGGLNSASSPNYLNTQKEVLTSEPVLAIAASLKPIMETREMAESGTTDSVAHLRSIVTAKVDSASDLLSVSAYSASPDDAATIANGVVDAYASFQTQSARSVASTAGDTLAVLQQKKAELEASIADKIRQSKDLESKYGILSRMDDHTNNVLRSLTSLSKELNDADAELNEKQMKADQAVQAYAGSAATQPAVPRPWDDDPDTLPLTPQALTDLETVIQHTEAMLEELEQRYMPEHPAILSRKRMLKNLRRRYVVALQRSATAAKAHTESLQQRYAEVQKQAVDLDQHAAEYARLQDDLTRDKNLRDNYDTQVRGLQLSRDASGLNIQVLDRAKRADKPSWPLPQRVLPIALVVGLCLGMMLACVREWVDDRFRTAGEIKQSLGMPLLAIIPQSTTKRSPSVSGQRILLDPGSDTAEAYRSLRASILYSVPEGQLRTLLVTSPCSGDGKTTLVSNLAIAMAQSGRRVLIVDADLRNPSQHDIFGVKNNTGLSALLAGRCTLETAVQRSHVQNLEILPCGPSPANPAEILNSEEFGETLETLAEKYDCVVLDSPPVEAVADSRIIAASCDGTLIVLKAQSAHRRTTEHTRDALNSVGARVLGLVVNDVPRRTTKTYGNRSATRKYVPGLTADKEKTETT